MARSLQCAEAGSVKGLADFAAGACALLFLAAALGKLDRWEAWSGLCAQIPGPPKLGRVVQSLVPIIEGAIVILCFVQPTIGLAAGAVVLAGFAIAVGLLARRLGGEECNCFGVVAPATISPRLATRNVVLAMLVAFGWFEAETEHLHALSLSKFLATLVSGAIVLMFLQYQKLSRTRRDIDRAEGVK